VIRHERVQKGREGGGGSGGNGRRRYQEAVVGSERLRSEHFHSWIHSFRSNAQTRYLNENYEEGEEKEQKDEKDEEHSMTACERGGEEVEMVLSHHRRLGQ